MEICELAKKSLYINPNIRYIFNTSILEYDMKNAGISIATELELLDEKEIKKLNRIRKMSGKLEASIEFGKMQLKNQKLKEGLEAGFIYFRNKFIQENNLEENDIISIKKDAFFVKKRVSKLKFGDNIEFRVKNEYTSYIHIKPLELYYNQNQLDIKGISDSAYMIHKDYMIKEIKKVFKYAEERDRESVLIELRKFYDKYKHLELDNEYYISFNSESKYIMNDGSKSSLISDIDNVNITYNMNIIIKLVKIML